MKLNLSVDEVLTTTRSVRKRLDVTKPVARSIIEECLDIALQAPNGSNQNVWRWVIVDDPALIKKLADFYKRATNNEFAQAYIKSLAPIPRDEKIHESSAAFMENIDKVPAMLIPLMPGRADGKSAAEQAVMWSSIVQAVWSFFLALRERGLGSAWTTITLLHEKEISDLLNIPFEQYTQVGLFPIAYTVGTDFKRAWRKPVSEVLTYNTF
jgi:nitroreductase